MHWMTRRTGGFSLSSASAERLEGLNLPERGNYWFGPGRTLITYWVRPKKLYSILASVPGLSCAGAPHGGRLVAERMAPAPEVLAAHPAADQRFNRILVGLERGRVRHGDDVVAGIDEMNVAGDAGREVREQI